MLSTKSVLNLLDLLVVVQVYLCLSVQAKRNHVSSSRELIEQLIIRSLGKLLRYLDLVQVALLNVTEVSVLHLEAFGVASVRFLYVTHNHVPQHSDESLVVISLADQGVHE